MDQAPSPQEACEQRLRDIRARADELMVQAQAALMGGPSGFDSSSESMLAALAEIKDLAEEERSIRRRLPAQEVPRRRIHRKTSMENHTTPIPIPECGHHKNQGVASLDSPPMEFLHAWKPAVQPREAKPVTELMLKKISKDNGKKCWNKKGIQHTCWKFPKGTSWGHYSGERKDFGKTHWRVYHEFWCGYCGLQRSGPADARCIQAFKDHHHKGEEEGVHVLYRDQRRNTIVTGC